MATETNTARPTLRARLFNTDWDVRVGIVLIGIVIAVAFIGPYVNPYDSLELVTSPFGRPGEGHVLGGDVLGRDVLSRVLAGGQTILVASLVAAAVAYLIGLPIGVLAAMSRTGIAKISLRSMDVILAFPPMLLVLILAASAGISLKTVVLGAIISQVPSIARVAYSASTDVARAGFVESARLRGEGTVWILVREILPNIYRPLAADVGVRVALSVLLITSANFLGVGAQPPQADWGAMLAENRGGLANNPYTVLVPGLLLATLTVGISFLADGLSQRSARSVVLVEEGLENGSE